MSTSTPSLSSAENSEPTYSSIISLNTHEDDNAFDETDDNEDDAATDDDEDNLICEINTHADHYRLCKAKTAHDAVLGKIDASLAKKPLTVNEAPHLNTKSLITKLDEVAITIDLDVSTIQAEQIKQLQQLDYGSAKDFQPNLRLLTFNSLRDYFDIAKNLTDS